MTYEDDGMIYAACYSWFTGDLQHQCQYKPGHKRMHKCPCGATHSVLQSGDRQEGRDDKEKQ